MSTKTVIFAILLVSAALPTLSPQEPPPVTIRPRPSEEVILALADVQPASSARAAELSEALKTFNQVLWDDLSFSGFFTLAGKSFYPTRPIVRPEDLDYEAWSRLPLSFLTTGTLDVVGGTLRAELRIFDMKQRTMFFGQRISGDPNQVRAMAHRWADEIVYKLTAGASRGIASTKIAFVSQNGKSKEIHVMDYDGHNSQAFTHNGSLNLVPNWAPDNSKLAFVSYRTGKPEINIHSFTDGSRIPFAIFNSFASTPSFSPDASRLAFALGTPRGDSDIFVSTLDGKDRRNITNNPAIEISTTWSPSGRQIAFSSDRVQRGATQIHICDVDGSNVRRIIKEGGDADAPAWSPDGKWIAFHWKPYRGSSYDIYLAEVSTGAIRQLPTGGGNNQSPSWAPDGRHIAFQSKRTGSWQIFVMLLDGSELRMVTKQGQNTSPAWSGYFLRSPGN